MAKPVLVSIVDDDESIRESLPDLVRQFGFAAQAFSSAEAFLSSESVDDTRCLILDVAMPGMNGIEATQILCSRNSHSKIIGLSVQPEAEIAQTMKDAGAVAFFNKGDDTSALIETIKKLAFQSFPA